MVYIDNDFYSTMVSNQKNGRQAQLKDQILDEIADLIAYHKAEVIEALNASGVLTKENASDQKVIDALITNVEKNRKLQAGLGYLITAKQTLKEDTSGQDATAGQTGGGIGAWFGNLFNSGGAAGAGGAVQGAAGGAGAGPIGAIIGAVSGAVGAVFNFKAAKTNAQAQADAQRMELANRVMARKGGSSNTGLYIGLGLLVVAAIVVVVVMKRKK